jgi:hypothetical protein
MRPNVRKMSRKPTVSSCRPTFLAHGLGQLRDEVLGCKKAWTVTRSCGNVAMDSHSLALPKMESLDIFDLGLDILDAGCFEQTLLQTQTLSVFKCVNCKLQLEELTDKKDVNLKNLLNVLVEKATKSEEFDFLFRPIPLSQFYYLMIPKNVDTFLSLQPALRHRELRLDELGVIVETISDNKELSSSFICRLQSDQSLKDIDSDDGYEVKLRLRAKHMSIDCFQRRRLRAPVFAFSYNKPSHLQKATKRKRLDADQHWIWWEFIRNSIFDYLTVDDASQMIVVSSQFLYMIDKATLKRQFWFPNSTFKKYWKVDHIRHSLFQFEFGSQTPLKITSCDMTKWNFERFDDDRIHISLHPLLQVPNWIVIQRSNPICLPCYEDDKHWRNLAPRSLFYEDSFAWRKEKDADTWISLLIEWFQKLMNNGLKVLVLYTPASLATFILKSITCPFLVSLYYVPHRQQTRLLLKKEHKKKLYLNQKEQFPVLENLRVVSQTTKKARISKLVFPFCRAFSKCTRIQKTKLEYSLFRKRMMKIFDEEPDKEIFLENSSFAQFDDSDSESSACENENENESEDWFL